MWVLISHKNSLGVPLLIYHRDVKMLVFNEGGRWFTLLGMPGYLRLWFGAMPLINFTSELVFRWGWTDDPDDSELF